jgi:hypothetical protein
MPGQDYTNFDAFSIPICRDSCGGDLKCQAFTWVRPGIQGPDGRCWLKSGVPPQRRNTCCFSEPATAIHLRDLQPESKTDRPGSDFSNFNAGNVQDCESACAGDRACSSWTYVRPGVQGAAARCWLKNAVALPVPNPDTVSGVKFRPRPVAIDPGTNLNPVQLLLIFKPDAVANGISVSTGRLLFVEGAEANRRSGLGKRIGIREASIRARSSPA